ncbi:hypothetical protein BHE74_00020012 [Ensete ventricosum]|nr:hypothetical protein GW17_00035330 [Ensete ventricosum]RWW72185.1 hypothetical protein BHE74_00020012 [Ensete ventricosum]RZR82835.1 hypothetical protein BHM03_00009362 [Ensete ventricosum]
MGRHHAKTQCDDEYSDLGNLSSEVSAIYLAMQNSKLECVDEHSQDTISTDGCVEPDENDEFDDFDPYLFIKDLPDLSAVVPRFRPMLLPKQTRSCPSTTLVLDLDGMLDNGIPIESWFDNRNDHELLSLLPFLESLAGVDDVRPLIAKKFNLREKVATAAAAASYLALDFRR